MATHVPESHSGGSFLPPGTSAALRPATAAGAAEILIENARLKFRVNDRKQTLAIKSNRERKALSPHHNLRVAKLARADGKQASPLKR
jgi:hypothetical protein